eukprot:NODE_515_length_7357_cov_0.487875.p2 type:complete len:449 gc:universal NODE_515_length_7357_cov_0.487875:2710-4056(+)
MPKVLRSTNTMKEVTQRKRVSVKSPYCATTYEEIYYLNSDDLFSLASIYLFDSESKNLRKGFAYMRQASKLNHLEATAITGFLCEFGIGCKMSYLLSEKYYLLAAKRGHGLGMARLSSLYRYGRPLVKISRALSEKYLAAVKLAGKETISWIYSAAEDYSEPSAQYVLGTFYHDGIYFNKDEVEAVKWYTLSANAEHPRGEGILGYCYGESVGLEKDVQKALHYYTKAAEKQETVAMYNIGYYMEEGISGKKDMKKAIYWYKEAAKRGNALACNSLGYMHEEGNGVEKDYAQAKEYYYKAAMAGNAWGSHNLGYLYSMGYGVEQDMNMAIFYYKKAALQGHSGAQNKLGYYYSNGVAGIDKNEKIGVFWYLIAAEQDLGTAQVNLAYCFERGCGVDIDLEKAIYWLEKASRQSDSRQNVEQWLASLVMRLCLHRGTYSMHSHMLASAA